MKKLRLRAVELGAKEILTRAQLKNVLGGVGFDGSGSGSGSGSGGPGGGGPPGDILCGTCTGFDTVRNQPFVASCTIHSIIGSGSSSCVCDSHPLVQCNAI